MYARVASVYVNHENGARVVYIAEATSVYMVNHKQSHRITGLYDDRQDKDQPSGRCLLRLRRAADRQIWSSRLIAGSV